MFNLESEVGSPVELPAMMEKFEIVLLAACRATRQIPEDRLDWEPPVPVAQGYELCLKLRHRRTDAKPATVRSRDRYSGS